MTGPFTIEQRIAKLENYLSELSTFLLKNDADVLENRESLYAIERVFLLVVDEAVDINSFLIISSSKMEPADYRSTFLVLGELGMLPKEVSEKMAPTVGLRNRLTHEYEGTDITRALRDIRKSLDFYRDYIQHIKKAALRA